MKFFPVFKVVASVTLRAFAIYFIFAMQALGTMRLPVENIQGAIMYSVIASVGWEMADFFSKVKVSPSPLLDGDFVECDTCREKPGAPVLCQGCLNNRNLIARLRKLWS